MQTDTALDDFAGRVHQQIAQATDTRELEALRVELFGRRGKLTGWLKQLGRLPPAQRRARGDALNRLRDTLTAALQERAQALARTELDRRLAGETLDVTLPGRGEEAGSLHPVNHTIRRIQKLFGAMGFETVTGPEIEDEWHNFEALNIPAWHPARAMQDTFYVQDGGLLLRTHTSPVQIRTMRRREPPIRIICPGRVYRRDFDRTHSPMFHQVEGLYVAKGVSLADLKYDLQRFLSLFFERDVEAMFRPSYFPFVEPGADVHIRWGDRWLEVLGCGVVHPNVLEAVDIDPQRYSGYAFGMGVERLAMLRYGVDDLRRFFDNDLRFLEQFA